MSYTPSLEYYQQACHLFPGGVQSPARAFKAVKGQPLFIKRAAGPYLFDVDNRRYIDYMGAWGASITGHAHPKILAALDETMKKGLCFGACTALENQFAQKIQTHMPHLERLRLCNSGTEATMTALRLARGYTRREKILLFEGSYHGHHDYSLERNGSQSGIPESCSSLVLRIPFNNIEKLKETFENEGESIAAVMIEPLMGNIGCILPNPNFLETLRSLCTAHESLLIFDEVITAFRLGLKGAVGLFHVTPDLTTMAKIVGGGLPMGILGGKKAIMERLAPQGPVFHAGTFSGNPMSVQAGLTTLEILEEPSFYQNLRTQTECLLTGWKSMAEAAGIALQLPYETGCFSLFFTENPINNANEAQRTDKNLFCAFFHALMKRGIYLSPSPMEMGFLSSMHDQDIIEETLSKSQQVFKEISLLTNKRDAIL
jgi:glutamate-1-semialdehyde 2,1-aminomutase